MGHVLDSFRLDVLRQHVLQNASLLWWHFFQNWDLDATSLVLLWKMLNRNFRDVSFSFAEIIHFLFQIIHYTSPFSISSSFILSFVSLPFFLNTKMITHWHGMHHFDRPPHKTMQMSFVSLFSWHSSINKARKVFLYTVWRFDPESLSVERKDFKREVLRTKHRERKWKRQHKRDIMNVTSHPVLTYVLYQSCRNCIVSNCENILCCAKLLLHVLL